jgi:hypothetical protein
VAPSAAIALRRPQLAKLNDHTLRTTAKVQT